MSRAIRMTPARLRALADYLAAGPAGVPLVLARWVELFAYYGFVETFEDPARTWANRVRLTPHGVVVAMTLCAPHALENRT